MAQGNSRESAQPEKLSNGYKVSDDELRQMQAQQRRRAQDVPRREKSAQLERRKARDWYWWLWLSPLLTVPTFAFFLFEDLGYVIICQGGRVRCDWVAAERVTILIAVLLSALWHLVLLIPALNKEHPFVRWHGRQALLLAGVRTAVLGFGRAFPSDFGAVFLVIAVQIVIWFGGTLWGQLQAAHGDCSLMRWLGQGELLASLQRADEEAGPVDLNVETLIATIRSSRDVEARRSAAARLKELGMVEPL